MDIVEFVKSIYLGDRCVKKITVDSWNREVSVEIDLISRIRASDGSWNYYTAEDIENGSLVFQKVSKLFFDEAGNIPNDGINDFEVVDLKDGSYRFSLAADSVANNGENNEATLIVVAEQIGLRDPGKPMSLIVS